jgi:hypothetical protein
MLQVSTRADFAPLWTSSGTRNVGLSTLTVSGLEGGVTYYFRVGSLNKSGAYHYATSVSTLMPIQLGVELTTHTLSLPGLTNMNAEILITTSIVVTNTGNVAETYMLSATTTTPGSPWAIAPTQAVDRFVLRAFVHPTEPDVLDFDDTDLLDDSEAACTTTTFENAAGEYCAQVAPGESRTLWFKISTPLATSTAAPQDIRFTARAVKDP